MRVPGGSAVHGGLPTKLPLEDICEDYGQVAYYLGTIPEAPHAFTLDDHHVFRMGMPVLVCGNTASMLQDTRFGSAQRSATSSCSPSSRGAFRGAS